MAVISLCLELQKQVWYLWKAENCSFPMSQDLFMQLKMQNGQGQFDELTQSKNYANLLRTYALFERVWTFHYKSHWSIGDITSSYQSKLKFESI